MRIMNISEFFTKSLFCVNISPGIISESGQVCKVEDKSCNVDIFAFLVINIQVAKTNDCGVHCCL